MKLLSLTMIFVMLLPAMPVLAANLVCDPQAGVVKYDVDVDGTIIHDVVAESDGSLLYNIDSLSSGPHTFKANAFDESGWESGWSNPLDASKPGVPGLRIVE